MQCCACLHLRRLAAQNTFKVCSLHVRSAAYSTEMLVLSSRHVSTSQSLNGAWGRQTTHQTAHGQLLDIATAPIGTVDLSRYTLPTYMRIVTFKTAFYSFYLPVACGLLVGGVTAPPAFALAKDICIQMGQYFQARFMHHQTASTVPTTSRTLTLSEVPVCCASLII